MIRFYIIFAFLVLTLTIGLGSTSNVVYNDPEKVQLRCVYKIEFKPDSTNRQDTKVEYAILLISNSYSKYYTRNKELQDSIINSYNNISSQNITSINGNSFPRTSFNSYIYKNNKSAIICTVDDIGLKTYLYEEDSKKIAWVISSQKKTLLGYSCQLATATFGGRNYQAWFTREIPFNTGPFKFGGLPGLIVQIHDLEKDYIFTLENIINVKHHNNLSLPDKNSYINTSKDKFNKAARYYRENYVDIQLQAGQPVYGDPETARRRVKENNRKRNNPIELVD